jgi:hypothetical protein
MQPPRRGIVLCGWQLCQPLAELSSTDRIENLAAQLRFETRGQRRGCRMSAQSDSLAERGEEQLAVRAGPEMGADFPAYGARQLIVEIGRQVAKNPDALRLRMPVCMIRMRCAVRDHSASSLHHHTLFK